MGDITFAVRPRGVLQQKRNDRACMPHARHNGASDTMRTLLYSPWITIAVGGVPHAAALSGGWSG